MARGKPILAVAARLLLSAYLFHRRNSIDDPPAPPPAPFRFVAPWSKDLAAPKRKAINHTLPHHLLCRQLGTFAFADLTGVLPRPSYRARNLAWLTPPPPPPKLWLRKEGRLCEIAGKEQGAIIDTMMPAGSINVRRNDNLVIPTCHRALPRRPMAPPAEEEKKKKAGPGEDPFGGLTLLEKVLLRWPQGGPGQAIQHLSRQDRKGATR